MEPIISISNLNYYYNNQFKALDNISFEVPKGSIYGFLGPNGAGKSTTMRMLSAILPDEHNNIAILGKPISSQIPEIFSNMGCLIEQPVLYSHLTAKDHLQLIMSNNDIPYDGIDELLSLVGLSKAKNLAVKRYSLGMKQRLAIALCLVKNPEILLLDEPVNGLDPNGMLEVRELLIKLNKEKGITIFISSHLLAELEKMCTHICIINKGKIHFQGTMESLKSGFEMKPVKITLGKIDKEILLPQYEFEQKDHQIIVHIQSKEAIPDIVKALTAQDLDIFEVRQEGSLESWFMEIIR